VKVYIACLKLRDALSMRHQEHFELCHYHTRFGVAITRMPAYLSQAFVGYVSEWMDICQNGWSCFSLSLLLDTREHVSWYLIWPVDGLLKWLMKLK